MTVGAVLISFIVGLLLALLVNREFRGRGVVRTLLIIPFLVLPAATALLWKNTMLGTTYGIVNWVIGLVGIPRSIGSASTRCCRSSSSSAGSGHRSSC